MWQYMWFLQMWSPWSGVEQCTLSVFPSMGALSSDYTVVVVSSPAVFQQLGGFVPSAFAYYLGTLVWCCAVFFWTSAAYCAGGYCNGLFAGSISVTRFVFSIHNLFYFLTLPSTLGGVQLVGSAAYMGVSPAYNVFATCMCSMLPTWVKGVACLCQCWWHCC